MEGRGWPKGPREEENKGHWARRRKLDGKGGGRRTNECELHTGCGTSKEVTGAGRRVVECGLHTDGRVASKGTIDASCR